MEAISSEAVKGSKIVDGVKVTTFSREIVSANIITVEVGTTGYMGGDTGHGGRTYFSIKDEASTDMRCNIVEGAKAVDFDYPSHIELMFGGDCEMDTFIEALEFAAEVLRGQKSGRFNLTPKEKQQEAFKEYLQELVALYEMTGKLRGMSELQRKYHVASITQIQFFECGLNKAAAKGRPVSLPQEFCNKVYEYVLDSTHTIKAPQYED